MTAFFIRTFKKENKCSSCPKAAYNGRTLCPTHLSKIRIRYRAWGVERRKLGRCYYCNRKSINGWLRCGHHAKINRERIRAWDQAHPDHARSQWLLIKDLRNKGLCSCRARNPLVPGTFRCRPCTKKGIGKSRARRSL